MQYKATTINGEPKLEPVCQLDSPTIFNGDNYFIKQGIQDRIKHFKHNNPPIPYIGPAIPDGTILDESEVEIVDEVYDPYDFLWKKITYPDTLEGLQKLGAATRRVSTMKAKEPEKKIATCKYCECFVFTPHGYCTECGNKRDSEEGEQPMKEESVKASKIIDEYVNGCCIDVPKRIGMDILKELYDHGYTLTKK